MTPSPVDSPDSQGNFGGGGGNCDTTSSHVWYYARCPAVNECELNLHSCHKHAVCIDTTPGYKCECKPGFQGDGRISCTSLCESGLTCKHGTCNTYNLCECDLGYTGTTCDSDCNCNGHSTCSQGQGLCDWCEHLTEGANCERCRAGAFRSGPHPRTACEPCQCNGHHDANRGYCDRMTGECYCTGHTRGHNCQLCTDGYYGNPLNGGTCYMVARSRVRLSGAEDMSFGNEVLERRVRGKGQGGYESVMWYVAPSVVSADIVLRLDALSSSSSTLPGTLFIWRGLPHVSESDSFPLAVFPFQLTNHMAASEHVITARDSISVIYEGSLAHKFNISYHIRNCTSHCADESSRFNTTCGESKKCVCSSGFMGPNCQIPICPQNCSGRGSCVESTGVCRCDPASSGVSCSERSSSQSTWSVLSYDWVPPGYQAVPRRMGHTTTHITINDTSKLVTFGGYDLLSPLGDLWMFDPDTLKWEEVVLSQPSPAPRYWHCSFEMSPGVLCVVGGKISDGILSDEVWCVNLNTTPAWYRLDTTDLPPIAGCAIAQLSSTLWYMFGGVTREGASRDLWQYDAQAHTWTVVHTRGFVPAVYGHTLTFYSKYLFLVSDQGYYKFNIDSNTWTPWWSSNIGTMPNLQFHSAVQYGGVLYITGGLVTDTHSVTEALFAVQLDTGGHVTLTLDQSAAQLGGQLVQSGERIYLIGGFNTTVHSAVLSFKVQSREHTCFYITDEETCVSFGCAWCDSFRSTPKPCTPTPTHSSCITVRSELPPCHIHTDCYTCSEMSCYWDAGTCTLPTQPQPIGTCNGTCTMIGTCTECNQSDRCVWYMDSCTHIGNVSPEWSRTCVETCHGILDCASCTVRGGCSWSVHLHRCLPDNLLNWSCLFNRCDLVVTPAQCPLDCSLHTTCSVCNEFNHCSWCQLEDGIGECMQRDWLPGTKSRDTRSKSRDTRSNDVTKRECAAWHFLSCPPENECLLDVHACRDDQVCLDLEQGYKCSCRNGTINSAELDSCVPSCATHGCLHGDCVAVDTCSCHFGYYGDDCRYMCDCSGHSACTAEGACAACQNHTSGSRCELCEEGYVRKGWLCIPCREVCNGHSDTCIDKTGAATGFLTVERVRCANCMNNTEGEFCERCQAPLFYHDKMSDTCKPCMCNGHAYSCDTDTGLGCQCGDNTVSSYKFHPERCTAAHYNTCHLSQCDMCAEGYSGDPVNGSLCYQNIREDKLYTFDTRSSAARPLFVGAESMVDHWVFVEMYGVSGVLFATTNPRKHALTFLQSPRSTQLYTAITDQEVQPTEKWVTGVDLVDFLYRNIASKMDCERRMVKFMPYPGGGVGLYLVVHTHSATAGQLRIQWYRNKYTYDYYLTSSLVFSGLILLTMTYCCMARLISFGLYLWQRRVRRVARLENSPKRLVSFKIDVSDHHLPRDTIQYSLPSRHVLKARGVKSRGVKSRCDYVPLSDVERPCVTPVAVHEFHIPDTTSGNVVTAGLCTVFIRLPGHPSSGPELILGSSVFKTKCSSAGLARGITDSDVVCETAI